MIILTIILTFFCTLAIEFICLIPFFAENNPKEQAKKYCEEKYGRNPKAKGNVPPADMAAAMSPVPGMPPAGAIPQTPAPSAPAV